MKGYCKPKVTITNRQNNFDGTGLRAKAETYGSDRTYTFGNNTLFDIKKHAPNYHANDSVGDKCLENGKYSIK